MQPISDDMATTSKIYVSVAKCERALNQALPPGGGVVVGDVVVGGVVVGVVVVVGGGVPM